MEDGKKSDLPEDLDYHRQAIDDIDLKILTLINQRLEHAQAIGKIKAQTGKRVIDQAREKRVINRLIDLNQGPLQNNGLRCIFADIIASAREIQRPQLIACIGPETSYSHMAALNYFGRGAEYVFCPNARDIFVQVEKGACHFGVVPIENAVEGTINSSLDLFFETTTTISGEVYQSITYELLSQSEKIEDISIIYSHPYVFDQCRSWLANHLPNVPHMDCESSMIAAHKASLEPNAAAIGTSETGRHYDLNIIARKIEDFPRNATRFLIIGKDSMNGTGKDKTTIMFSTSHNPGALYQVLEPLAEYGVNMLKLESRPSRYETWKYFFFADIDGHMDNKNVNEALQRVKEKCMFYKWLGSYPISNSLDLLK